jgi:aryl-alcohol dehydrogenase-like predicted oxidoreductase
MVKLGTTELKVSPLGLGGNVFGWTADEPASFAVLDAYRESGGCFLDTADAYSHWVEGNAGGESEDIIGRWMRSRSCRDDTVVATKVGQHPDASGLSRSSIRAGVEASLRRLRTNYIDLYYAHFDDPDTPLEETLAALDELVQEGKVRYLAASNYSVERLTEALLICDSGGLERFVAFQVHYNLARRDRFEQRYRALLCREGIVAIPYYSLANGFLTGKYRRPQDLASNPREKAVARMLDERGHRVLAALDEVAAAHGAAVATVALAWLAAQPAVAAPLASARTPAQLRDLTAFPRLPLSESELALLDEVSA